MIVRPGGESLHLITQPDHAQLAGLIMSRSTGLRGHPRRRSILRAVAEHDNGWREEDEAPLADRQTGRVIDFVTAPLEVRHHVWPRGVARLEDDPWAAALVAQHAVTVYDRFRSDGAWDSFFREMEAARDRLRQSAGLPLDVLLEDYRFVRLGDLISLAFCTGWTDENRFAEWTVQRDGERVLIAPDPFGGEDIPLHIDARELPMRAYFSDEDLRRELAHAPSVTLTGSVGRRAT